MKHVMIDIETLGLAVKSTFTNIGAVMFDPNTGEIGEKFYQAIDWDSSFAAGRTVDQSVLKWWMSMDDDALAEILQDGEQLRDVLYSFGEWLPEDAIVWGNGATFDISKLESAYGDMFGKDMIPWEFHAVRDCRTIRDLAEPWIKVEDISFEGIKHHALYDAIHQAKYVSAMWRTLRDRSMINE